jgi:YVTN family beta-propeller protein
MKRPDRRALASAAVVALALLAAWPGWSPGAVAGRSGSPAVTPGAAPPPPMELPSANTTLALTNGSLVNSSWLPGNGRNPTFGVYDEWNGNSYFVDADTGVAPTENVSVLHGAPPAIVATVAIGSGPWSATGIAVDPAQGDVFVANSAFGTVSVVNGTSETVRATVRVGFAPTSIAYDPVNGSMVVADRNSSELSFLNDSTGSVVGTTSVGTSPTTVIFDPVDSDLWVTDVGANAVEVVNGTSGRLIGSVPLGWTPASIALDPVSGDVYVVNPVGGNVSVLNVTRRVVVTTVTVDPDPTAIAYDGADAFFYVPSGSTGIVDLVSPRTKAVAARVFMPATIISAVYDNFNAEVYCAEAGSGGVAVLKGTTSSVFATIPTGRGTRGLVPDLSNGWVFVADVNASAVDVINATSNRFSSILPTAAAPDGLAYDPSSDEWYVSDPQAYSGFVVVVDGLTHRVMSSVPVGSDPAGIADDPANRSVAVADAGSDEITFVSTGGGGVVGASYLPYAPGAIALDPIDQGLFVADPANASVTIVNGTNGAIDRTVAVGADPVGVAYDAAADAMIVANRASSNLSVLDARSGLVLGTIPVTGSPRALAYDPADKSLFVVDEGGAAGGANALESYVGPALTLARSLVAAPPLGPLVYDAESGLLYVDEPTDSRLVAVDGSTDAVAGSFPTIGNPTVLAVGGIEPVVASAESASGSVAFRVPPLYGSYPVKFSESGLPSGAAWSVTLNGQVNRSVSSNVSFEIANGTNYPFTIGVVLGFRASPANGTLVVAGSPVLEEIRFTLIPSGPSTPSPGYFGLSGYGPAWATAFLALSVVTVSVLVLRRLTPGRSWGPLDRAWARAMKLLSRRRTPPAGTDPTVRPPGAA